MGRRAVENKVIDGILNERNIIFMFCVPGDSRKEKVINYEWLHRG
jgi:hypothetical protein